MPEDINKNFSFGDGTATTVLPVSCAATFITFGLSPFKSSLTSSSNSPSILPGSTISVNRCFGRPYFSINEYSQSLVYGDTSPPVDAIVYSVFFIPVRK